VANKPTEESPPDLGEVIHTFGIDAEVWQALQQGLRATSCDRWTFWFNTIALLYLRSIGPRGTLFGVVCTVLLYVSDESLHQSL